MWSWFAYCVSWIFSSWNHFLVLWVICIISKLFWLRWQSKAISCFTWGTLQQNRLNRSNELGFDRTFDCACTMPAKNKLNLTISVAEPGGDGSEWVSLESMSNLQKNSKNANVIYHLTSLKAQETMKSVIQNLNTLWKCIHRTTDSS